MARVRGTEQDHPAIPAAPAATSPARDQSIDDVDEASRDSFPASDPPAWNGVRLGSPCDPSEPADRAKDQGR